MLFVFEILVVGLIVGWFVTRLTVDCVWFVVCVLLLVFLV